MKEIHIRPFINSKFLVLVLLEIVQQNSQHFLREARDLGRGGRTRRVCVAMSWSTAALYTPALIFVSNENGIHYTQLGNCVNGVISQPNVEQFRMHHQQARHLKKE